MTERMKMDLVIVGGGPAGMAAAVAAYEAGIRDLVILEREDSLGGILKQCIHNGFGLHRFGEELTGPEYAYRYEKQVRELGIPFMTDTMVIDISENKTVTAMNKEKGIFLIDAKAVILAMGCRERPRGALNTPGTRPAGVYTAGTAQKYVNMKGYMPGKEVVILGSGDIGLARNIEQCLNDFGIPLRLSHTVVDIHGKDRLTGVTIAKVDENRRPIPETREYIPCDTLLLSCGLIPENELTRGAGITLDRVTNGAVVDGGRETEIEGVFACGNVLHVHDLVDFVSEEAVIAGNAAAEYIKGREAKREPITIKVDGKIRYTVPQRITAAKDTTVYFRVADVFLDKRIVVKAGEKILVDKKKIKLAPGEMESVTLTADMISSVPSGEISFSLLDKGGMA